MEIREIQLKSAILYNLVEIGGFYVKGSASWPELSEAIKKTHEDLTKLGQDYAAQQESCENPEEIDPVLDIVEESLNVVEQLDEQLQKQVPRDEMKDTIDNLEELNQNLAEIQNEIPLIEIVTEEMKDYDEEELIEIVTERAGEERVLTTNYLAVEKSVDDYVNDIISQEEHLNNLACMRELVTASSVELENFAKTIKDWKKETILEKNLLAEGFKQWLDALDILTNPGCLNDKDEETITAGMETAYSANEKLVMAQELTAFLHNEYIKSKKNL